MSPTTASPRSFPSRWGRLPRGTRDCFIRKERSSASKAAPSINDYANKHNGDSKWWYGLTFWTPNINIFRDPRWGRGQETYGEDPYLTGAIGVEFVKGIQGDDPNYMLAMACAKHYAVHSGPESERHRFDAEISDRDLYETYLPQFERVVREGKVAGVMGAYSALDGVPDCANSFLLTDLLRNQWGFEGYVVSDCDAIGDIWRSHHYVKTAEEAAAAAVKAGCDLCCGGDYNALVRAVQQGLVTEKDIDQALYYTLWTRFKLGLFDPADKVPYSKYTIKDNDTPEHQQVALELARQSLVLLKNDGILPLDRSKLKRIAVIGPNGKSTSMLNGNYHGSASHPVSILDGIKQLAGPNIEVTFALGSPITTKRGTAAWSAQDNTTTRPLADLTAEALGLATNADLIIYVGGLTPAQEGEGFDRDSIELPDVQEKLVRGASRHRQADGHGQLQRFRHRADLGGRTSAGDSPSLVSGRGRRSRRGGSLVWRGQSFRPLAGDILPCHRGFARFHRLFDDQSHLPLLQRQAALCVRPRLELHQV